MCRWGLPASGADPWLVEGAQRWLLLTPHPGAGYRELRAVGEGCAASGGAIRGRAGSRNKFGGGCREPGRPSSGRLYLGVGGVQLWTRKWRAVGGARAASHGHIRRVQMLEWLQAPPADWQWRRKALEDPLPPCHLPAGGCGQLVLRAESVMAVQCLPALLQEAQTGLVSSCCPRHRAGNQTCSIVALYRDLCNIFTWRAPYFTCLFFCHVFKCSCRLHFGFLASYRD